MHQGTFTDRCTPDKIQTFIRLVIRMLVIHGHYKFARRPTAFRNGHCHHCESCTRHIQYRFFMVMHLFWLPLLPLGFWREWQCTQCSRDPAPVARRGFWWALWLLLLLGTFAGWSLPIDPTQIAVSWFMRLGLPLCALGLGWHLRKKRTPMQACTPANEAYCPVCGGTMDQTTPPHCLACGVLQR